MLARLVPQDGFVFGAKPTSLDAALYGSIANIYFFEIDRPLRGFVLEHQNLVRHCKAIHAAIAA